MLIHGVMGKNSSRSRDGTWNSAVAVLVSLANRATNLTQICQTWHKPEAPRNK